MKLDHEYANRIFQRMHEAEEAVEAVRAELSAYQTALVVEVERVDKVLRGQWKPGYAAEEGEA